MLLDSDSFESDLNIGIIDGGISKNNTFLKPYIKVREEYVSTAYINESHATFIASTIQYGNKLNGISCANVPHFNFIDIVAIPNSDKNYIRLILSVKKNLWKLLKRSWINMQHQLKCGNMSLGIENKVCNGTMSDLGIFFRLYSGQIRSANFCFQWEFKSIAFTRMAGTIYNGRARSYHITSRFCSCDYSWGNCLV